MLSSFRTPIHSLPTLPIPLWLLSLVILANLLVGGVYLIMR